MRIHHRGDFVTWETSFDVSATEEQIYDAVEEYRSTTYGTRPGHFIRWTSHPQEGAQATLLDQLTSIGHVAIHCYRLETGGFHLRIQALGQLVSQPRHDEPRVNVYAQELATALQNQYGVEVEESEPIDEGWEPPTCIFSGNEGEFYGQAVRRLRARGMPVDQVGYSLHVSEPEGGSRPTRAFGQYRLYSITPWGIAGDRCRLEFKLDPLQTSWNQSRASIERLLEDLVTDEFIESVQADGEQPLGDTASRQNTEFPATEHKESLTQSQDSVSDSLTPREQEIAQLLAEGKGKKEIADTLITSSDNVKTHCKNISRKWELGTTTTAVMQDAARERLEKGENPLLPPKSTPSSP